MNASRYDIAIIGGGILGTATAMALSRRWRLSLLVLEAADRLAAHQSGNNSGVIHSGLYYKPGSLKAHNCILGREAMYRFCAQYGIAHERCGKLVIASTEEELPALQELERRGRGNGLRELRRLGPGAIREHEPHASGIAALLVPDTGIVDYAQVTSAFAEVVRQGNGDVLLGARVNSVRRDDGGFSLETGKGEFRSRYLLNCAGLQSDRIARMCGVEPGLKIVPFRGEYYELVPQRRFLVRNLIYPVPNPDFPFLGVHFTRRIDGRVEVGPNAVLAFKREGYRRASFSATDATELLAYSGFRRMARVYWREAAGEFYRSFSKRAFVRELRKLVPGLNENDIRRAGSGVRAQAVEPSGRLVDDFKIVEADGMIHVLNAPSPAATASISIGELIADIAARKFELGRLTRDKSRNLSGPPFKLQAVRMNSRADSEGIVHPT